MLLFYYTKHEHALSNLRRERIKLSKAGEMNDPFELSPAMDPAEYTPASFRAFLLREDVIRDKHKQECAFVPFNKYKRAYMRTLSKRIADRMANVPRTLETTRERFVELFDKHMRFVCFSKTPGSILMWSHYASNHTGAIIGFDSDIAPLNDPGNVLVEVSYKTEKEYFRYNPGNPGRELIESVEAIVGRKSPDWEYEQEVRMMLALANLSDDKFWRIPPRAVSIVIFGCRGSEQSREDFRAILTEPQYQHVAIYQAERSKDKFELEFQAVRKTDRASL